MRIHTIEKIEKIKELRKNGASINEIVSALSIPKTTVWHHCHEIKILPRYLSIWISKRGGSAKRKQKNWESAQIVAQQLLNGPQRESAIMLAMLYWSEGNKKACEFINSDGKMINLYLNLLMELLGISTAGEMIKPTMRIFSGMNRQECLSYWSRITKIPKNKFVIRFNDGGTRGKTKYGMCRITVKKGAKTLKIIQSLIGQIYEEKPK